MSTWVATLAVTAVASAAGGARYTPSQRQSIGLWPLPSNQTSGDTTLAVLSSGFTFPVTGPTTPTLTAVIKRYQGLIFLHGTGEQTPDRVDSPPVKAVGSDALNSCSIKVADGTEVLTWGMDESYSLEVSTKGCAITAHTFVGVGYALETLSQLVLSDGGVYSSGSPTYWIPNTPWAITDTPRFGYRGLMVDTARHFLPLNALRRQIDGLSFNKMNALHWHLTDAQSTPLASKAFPNLQLGAFHPNAVYTLDDIKGIVEYARLRGVQILLEIDMPGHSFAFGVGYPELILNCSSMYPLETEFWTSSLDITRGEQLYSWLETLLTELTAVLPNTLFHIGGDEVQYQCWSSSDVMVAYLKSRNITAVQLYHEFESRMMAILKKLGKDSVTWDSTFQTGMTLPPGAVVHDYQGGTASVAAIAKAGVKVIVSSMTGDYVAAQTPWTTIFGEEMMPAGLTASEEANVLGGAAAMWGETMDDSDIDTIVWPDTAAVAERLWSPPGSVNPQAYNTSAATLRMIPHRCRLYQRGIRAKPLDDRDGFGRRRLQAQCETTLPTATAQSLPPLSFGSDEL